MTPLLSVKNLNIIFHQEQRDVHAVRGASFTLYQSEMLAIVGESGSGKSVTAKALMHLLPSEGNSVYADEMRLFKAATGAQCGLERISHTISSEDEQDGASDLVFSGREHCQIDKTSPGKDEDDVTDCTDSPRKRENCGLDLLQLKNRDYRRLCGTQIAIIMQDPMTALNPTMTIGKQIEECIRRAFPKLSSRSLKTKTLELLSLVKLPDPARHYRQYPFELSGGMCQRVAIAMAFAFSPQIIIADEPTTALDVTTQSEILKLMKDLQKKTQTSIILITHDLSIVARYCDRVIVMYAGKIVESASICDLFYHPKHPYTQLLLQSLPNAVIEGDRLTPIEGKPPDLSKLLPGCSFFDRCPYAMEICENHSPPLTQMENKHDSACWLHHKKEPL
ncbi:MAG: ABC transporter ATP-binding protein [Simkaniaceae bacterium]|nr:ABC transporter ATP-binding protein [Simkaniaceae bacterium]